MNKQEIIDYVSHTPFNSNENVLRGMLDQLTDQVMNNVKLYQFQFKNISYDAAEKCASLNNISDFNITADDLFPNEHRYVFAWADYEGDFTIKYEDSNQDRAYEIDFTYMSFCSNKITEEQIHNTLFINGLVNFVNNDKTRAYGWMQFIQGNGITGTNMDKIYAYPEEGAIMGTTIEEVSMHFIYNLTEMPFTLNILVVEH